MSENGLRYVSPFQSFVDSTFFEELSRLKLNILKLNTHGVPIQTALAWGSANGNNGVMPLFLNGQSFDVDEFTRDKNSLPLKGELYNFNTIEEFKTLNKMEFLAVHSERLYNEGKSNIDNSVAFRLISFADLKKYKFYYWLCIPSYQPKSLSIKVTSGTISIGNVKTIQQWFKSNPANWVCLIDKDNGNIYSYDTSHRYQNCILAVRDISRTTGIPSFLARNLLSVFYHDNMPQDNVLTYFIRPDESSFGLSLSFHYTNSDSQLTVNGWEKNPQGKLAPRGVDLGSLVDPLKLAEQSVDLNLKLMKWRVAPQLDLDTIKQKRTLILGAGTLGCYVSRALMAWGVQKITLLDNSNVSMSNPVRQPLFEFQDYGKPKAETAANALKRIFPMMDAQAANLMVPMIGHPIIDAAKERAAYEELHKLIKTHDAIFLLMDSRETRWLPTVLANVEGKTVINAALGFDSYLVMRHGQYDTRETKQRLGCYFCHDVVAPTDSLTDRTLDQMCTVTRPGVAMLAASQAVELYVSMLQGCQGEENVLGEIPHQIRGFLHNFTTMKLETPAYEHCSACSPAVVEACREMGWDFVKNALNDEHYIETLSGLVQVKNSIDNMSLAEFDWEEEEEEQEEEQEVSELC